MLIIVNLLIVAAAGIYAARGRGGAGAKAGGGEVPDNVAPRGGDARAIDWPQAADAPEAIAVKPDGAALSTREVVARCEASVAQIKGRFSRGSGFLVKPGMLATNAHVVGGELPDDLRVYFPSQSGHKKGPYRATLIYEDVPRDLAILKLEVTFPPLPLATPYAFRRGEDVTVIGSPGVDFVDESLPNAVSRGVLSTEMVAFGQKFYQLGASVNPGNSGGPAIDSKGDVVGVVTLKAKQESIGFCVPVDDLAGAIDRARLVKVDEARILAARHAASAVLRGLMIRGVLCALSLGAHAKKIEEILGRQGDGSQHEQQIQTLREGLTALNQKFDDGYRVAVSELLSNPEVQADVRRDLRNLWSTCDDMSALALDARPNLRNFRESAGDLVARFTRLVERLKRDLVVEDP